jgi:serine protease
MARAFLFRHILGAVLVLSSPAAAAPRDGTDQLIVRLRDKAASRASALGAGRMSLLSARAGLTLRHLRAMSGDAQVLALPYFHSRAELDALIRRLSADPDVESVEPDELRYPSLVPNDTSYGSQWHYQAPAVYPGAANLPSAWDVTTGASSIVVAVLDTGITSHSELSGRTAPGYDFIASTDKANDGDGRDSDPSDPGDWVTTTENASGVYAGCGVSNSSWHGTHVAGTIGAASDNGSLVAGVNWTSKILPVRILGKCGGYSSDLIDAIRWAAGIAVSGAPVNANPARVINMSLGGSGACPAAEQSAVNDAIAAGAVVVAATGNSNSDANNTSPASCAGVISVTAVTQTGIKASYANTGTTVKIAAPGGDSPANPQGVLSAHNTGTTSSGSATSAFRIGTSMAAPHVAGVASLMLSVEPSLTPAQVLAKMQSTARGFPDASCNTSLCGAGLLDANLAVRASVLLPSIAGIAATAQGVSSITYTWSFSGATPSSYKVYYATSDVLIASPASPSFTLQGLPPNQSMTLRASAVRFTVEGSTTVLPSGVTLGSPPSSPVATPHISSITMNYAPCAASACSGYQLDVSTASNLTGVLYSSATSNPASASLRIAGLSPLTTYYSRLSSLNSAGALNPIFPGLIYTQTDKVAPIITDFSGIDVDRIQLNWLQSLNPSGATYQAVVSTASDFTGSIQTLSGVDRFSALFTGLSPNTSYYFRVLALGGPTASSGPVSTLGAAPALSTGLTGASTSTITLNWSANGNRPGTLYQAELSSSAGFGLVTAASQTSNGSASFSGLLSNTVYFGRARTIPNAGPATAFTALGSASTLAVPPGLPGQPFHPVDAYSVTASWLALPAAPQASSAEGYRLDISAQEDFSGVLFSSSVAGSASSTATIKGLDGFTTYYARVGSLNWDGIPNFTLLGSTRTLHPILSSSVFSGGELNLSLVPAAPQLRSISVTAPAGIFPSGTVLTINSSIGPLLPETRSTQGQIRAIADGLGVSISADGAQPAGNMTIRMEYDPLFLGGGNPSLLQICRYDDVAGTWSILPGTVDTRTRTLTALTNHLSFFAPFFVTAGSGLDAVNIFPIPWQPGSSDALFNAPALTFSNLPGGSLVRLFTIDGELLWRGEASAGGILTWSGVNGQGRNAGSGTYLVVIEKDGSRSVKRVVVIR